MGNVTAGYGKSYKSPESTTSIGTGTVVEYYENTGLSIGMAINDELSVSYSAEDSSANQRTSTNTIYDISVDSIQLAYSLGGATLSLARADTDNVGYANGVDQTDTIIKITETNITVIAPPKASEILVEAAKILRKHLNPFVGYTSPGASIHAASGSGDTASAVEGVLDLEKLWVMAQPSGWRSPWKKEGCVRKRST